MTKCVAVEFSRRKHPVTAILLHPGTVNTDLSRPFHGNGETRVVPSFERVWTLLGRECRDREKQRNTRHPSHSERGRWTAYHLKGHQNRLTYCAIYGAILPLLTSLPGGLARRSA